MSTKDWNWSGNIRWISGNLYQHFVLHWLFNSPKVKIILKVYHMYYYLTTTDIILVPGLISNISFNVFFFNLCYEYKTIVQVNTHPFNTCSKITSWPLLVVAARSTVCKIKQFINVCKDSKQPFSNIKDTWAIFSNHDVNESTQITIAQSVDKGWIVVLITVVDQWWFHWFGRTKNEYHFIPVESCRKAPASYFKEGSGCLVVALYRDKSIFVVCLWQPSLTMNVIP